ncbi:MAG: glycine dehydrogenase, partial [Solirubrobacterales bacterium]
MTRYTSATERDREQMLAAVGAASVEELFEDIPPSVRLERPLDLPAGMPEAEVYERLAELGSRNANAETEITFLGAGMYDHYVPAIVDSITQRSEFLTPYTPYQPEISQGTLQAMFEFQTAISELTGLPVASAGLYEMPSSVASAGYLAKNATGRDRFLVSRGLHPHAREALATYAAGFGAEIEEVPLAHGATDLAALEAAVDERVAAVFLQQPNFLGTVEDMAALAPAAKRSGGLLVTTVDAPTLGILRPPGEF